MMAINSNNAAASPREPLPSMQPKDSITMVYANTFSFVVKFFAYKETIKKDEKIIDEVLPLIEEVREIWNEAYKISIAQR